MGKRRILFTGEASFLSTGFATFNREILKRLHATGKYEIAEMGSYAQAGDPRSRNTPWRFYPVLPNNQAEKEVYDKNPQNQFGRYKIDSVLADFQPDIVFDARDPWMIEHLADSRFRDKYSLVLMPTVDSAPQKREWIENIFKKADVVTTYSRYGKRVLESEGLKVQAVTSPGINLDVFKPLDKNVIRDEFHMTPSLFIFGTVMRNQKRKLFPDLFDAYRQLRIKHAKPAQVKRVKDKVLKAEKAGKKPNLSKAEKNVLRIDHSALYCHTSYPDLGWDIPNYLYRFGIQRHVIFTYLCEACDAVYANWFAPCDKTGTSVCRHCGEHAAHMPNTHKGVSEEQLVKIFNLFDAYVQPAICEGWGLPIMESKACGVPGIYQNYSAMEDHVENGGGSPIKIGRFYHEAETGAVRSLPDIDNLVSGMEKLAVDDKFRKRKAKEARECAVKMHDWGLTANKLIGIFDNIELKDRMATWDKHPEFNLVTPESPPANVDDQGFVHWCYVNILHRLPDAPGMNNWMGSLKGGTPRAEVEAYFRNLVSTGNNFEQMRWSNSLKNRGLELPKEMPIVLKEDYMPGMIV
jgi:glycosyltransferase involved in cell wall biosynthesis